MSSEARVERANTPQLLNNLAAASNGYSSADDAAISVRNVGKMYMLYDKPQDRLKQSLFWRVGRNFGRPFWALRDVSFEVKRGESVGIIGRNGSGKSTLLQIIAGTLQPTTGSVQVNGRVAALLELGSGFNPEYTGRENIWLNASILGLTQAEITERYEHILAFADIGDFINQPIKTYSSGMVIRLAFAVMINAKANTLIVDEALSVGDMFFQNKCLAAIKDLKRQGTTVLLVSHELQSVKALCERAILLEKGGLFASGPVKQVADFYSSLHLYEPKQTSLQTFSSTRLEADYVARLQPPFGSRITERTGRGAAKYYECCVLQGDREVDTVRHGEMCHVLAWLEHFTDLEEEAEVGLLIRNRDGLELFAVNSYFLGVKYGPRKQGERTRIDFEFPITLAPGIYNIVLGLRVPIQGEYWDKVFDAAIFRVVTPAGVHISGLFSNPGQITFNTL